MNRLHIALFPFRQLLAGFLVVALMGPLPALGAEEAATSAASQGKVESTIAITSDTATDSRIKLRVRQLFATIDGLQDVDVAVNGGVIVLSGVAASKAVHEQAIKLAQRVEGVVDIRDRIEASRDLRRRISQLSDRLTALYLSFVGYLPLLLVAAVVVATFWWVAQRIANSRMVARRLTSNPFMRDFVRQLIRVVITGLGLLLSLQILDASTLVGSVLGAAGVVGLALGFALRDTVENYIASLLLSLRQPFSRDDLVSIEGFEGRIVRLTARATILMTLDGNHTRIPNGKVYKAIIVNYTRNPKRRFQFEVGVDTEQNLAVAQALAANTLAQMDGVLRDPAPSCTVQLLGDSNVILRVFGWVDQREAEFLKVRSEAIRLVKGAFDRAGVVMPEPIYNVRVGPGSAALALATKADSSTSLAGAGSAADKSRGAEPKGAIDIAPRDELEGQIAADHLHDEEDLLRNHAPKE